MTALETLARMPDIFVGAKDDAEPIEIMRGRIEEIIAQQSDAIAQRFHSEQKRAQIEQARRDRRAHQQGIGVEQPDFERHVLISAAKERLARMACARSRDPASTACRCASMMVISGAGRDARTDFRDDRAVDQEVAGRGCDAGSPRHRQDASRLETASGSRQASQTFVQQGVEAFGVAVADDRRRSSAGR